MPLTKKVLELKILAAFQKMSTSETDMATAQKDLANELATAIDAYIKSATIVIPPGQSILGTSPSGPVTGTTSAASPEAIIT